MKKIVLTGLATVGAVAIAVPVALGAAAPAPKATGNVNWVYTAPAARRHRKCDFQRSDDDDRRKGPARVHEQRGWSPEWCRACLPQVGTHGHLQRPDHRRELRLHGDEPVLRREGRRWRNVRCHGDKIAVLANEGRLPDCSGDPGTDLGDVTSGNLTVF